MDMQQLDAAWGVIREARSIGLELVIDAEKEGRLFYRPAGTMPLDLYRRLREHKAAVIVLLVVLRTPIPHDGAAPGVKEPCRYFGARRCVIPIAWQCGRCHGLWRPAKVKEPAKVKPPDQQEQGA
jgi:hypothetical protein